MAHTHTHADLIALPVAEVMNHPVYSVAEDVVLADVLTAMVRTGRRHLAVVDRHGRCLGVVGDRAVAAAWAADPGAMGYVTVRRILDRRPSVVGTDARVHEVARAMFVDRVDAVVVIDRHGCPAGMVTGGDLIALMAKALPSDPDAGAPGDAPDDGPSSVD
jgi:predicted transcriptional regulator